MEASFEKELKNLIIKNSILRISESEITDESDIINDFGYNSITIIQIVIDIEREFGIEFEEDDLAIDIIGNYKTLKEYIGKRIPVR